MMIIPTSLNHALPESGAKITSHPLPSVQKIPTAKRDADIFRLTLLLTICDRPYCVRPRKGNKKTTYSIAFPTKYLLSQPEIEEITKP